MIATRTRPKLRRGDALDEIECANMLVAFCRRDFDPSGAGTLLDTFADEAARRLLLSVAFHHGVAGLAVSALTRAAETAGVEGPLRDDLDDLMLGLRRRAAMFAFERERILHLLQRAGIQPLVLKGAALSETIYRDPSERDLRDVDVMVRPQDLQRVVKTLVAAGYALPPWTLLRSYFKHHFHLPLQCPGRPAVEVHWALARADGPFDLDPENVLRRATLVAPTGESVFLVPSREDMALHMVLQNVQEGFSRLSRTVDLDRLLAPEHHVDWDGLLRLSREGNLDHATALSLRLSASLMGTEMPATVLDRLRPSPAARPHLAALGSERSLLGRRSVRSHVDEQLLQLWLLPHWAMRVSMLYQVGTGGPLTPSRKEPQGRLLCTTVLAKMLFRQALLSAKALGAWLTREGRFQMRFWSSHASSSERL